MFSADSFALPACGRRPTEHSGGQPFLAATSGTRNGAESGGAADARNGTCVCAAVDQDRRAFELVNARLGT